MLSLKSHLQLVATLLDSAAVFADDSHIHLYPKVSPLIPDPRIQPPIRHSYLDVSFAPLRPFPPLLKTTPPLQSLWLQSPGIIFAPPSHVPHPVCQQICQFCLQNAPPIFLLPPPPWSEPHYLSAGSLQQTSVSLLPHSPALHSAETLLKPKSDMSLPCSPPPSGFPAWPAFDGCQGSVLSPAASPISTSLATDFIFMHAKHPPAPGPFLCLECLSLRCPTAWTLASFRSLFKCHLISQVFPDYPNSNSMLCPHFLSPLSVLFLFTACLTI